MWDGNENKPSRWEHYKRVGELWSNHQMSCYTSVNGGFTQVFMGNFNHAKWGLGGRSEIMTIGRKIFNVQPKTFHQPPFLPIFFDNIPSHTGCLKWAVFFFDLLLKTYPSTQLSHLVYFWYTESVWTSTHHWHHWWAGLSCLIDRSAECLVVSFVDRQCCRPPPPRSFHTENEGRIS